MCIGNILQECESMVFLRQIFEEHGLIFIGLFTIQVVYTELLKVTYHNPVGSFSVLQIVSISFGLFIGSKKDSTALFYFTVKVNTSALLFYQHPCRCDISVNTLRFWLARHTHTLFKVDEHTRIFYTINML